MTIQQIREEAIQRLRLFQERYSEKGDTFVPLNIARRWAHAFEGDETDLDEVAQIVRDAERDKDEYDLAFHAFCNEMRNTYSVLWREFLSKGRA